MEIFHFMNIYRYTNVLNIIAHVNHYLNGEKCLKKIFSKTNQ